MTDIRAIFMGVLFAIMWASAYHLGAHHRRRGPAAHHACRPLRDLRPDLALAIARIAR
jgi:hypothetical protein